jgi:hypothetical protein
VIDVDPRKWADSNGQMCDAEGRFDMTDLRADVRSYVLNLVQQAPMLDETEAEVSL